MLLRNLATALLEHGRIETTLAKAKEVQPYTEKLITLAKGGWNLNNFRRVLAVVTNKAVAFKLAKVRQGDAAPMGVIALLGENEQVKAPAKPAVVGS